MKTGIETKARSRRTARVQAWMVAATLMAAWIGTESAAAADIVYRIASPRLYPEGIAYDARHDRFLVGSLMEGTIHQIDRNGTVTVFVQDPGVPHSVGIHVDQERNRLLVPSSNTMLFRDPSLPSHAELAAYDLDTGERLFLADLSQLTPDGPNVVNDVTVDDQGNAYVTDSLVPAIYKVTPAGEASLFWRDDTLGETGAPTLNGIDYHPDGFLLVPINGSLYRVPLNEPTAARPVDLNRSIKAADGIILDEDGSLVIVQNTRFRVVRYESSDGWETARRIARARTSVRGVATTAAIRDGEVYVVYSHLLSLMTGIGNPEVFEIARVGGLR
jgi:sugar lactone lactonase YvrE